MFHIATLSYIYHCHVGVEADDAETTKGRRREEHCSQGRDDY